MTSIQFWNPHKTVKYTKCIFCIVNGALKDIKLAFDIFDGDLSGIVDPQELK